MIDNKIKLWSFSYQDEVFHFWREGVLNIEPKFEDKEMYQQDAINYYWTFKVYTLYNNLKTKSPYKFVYLFLVQIRGNLGYY